MGQLQVWWEGWRASREEEKEEEGRGLGFCGGGGLSGAEGEELGLTVLAKVKGHGHALLWANLGTGSSLPTHLENPK